jgi:hypothetical protein
VTAASALYPFAVSEALSLRLHDFDDPVAGGTVDVKERPAVAGDGDGPPRGPTYDASANRAWSRLNFALHVDLADSELSYVLPSTSRIADDTALVVLVTCASTRLRQGIRLRHVKAGRWSGHASIQRQDIKGAVQLRPQLVRSSSIPDDDALPFATRPGSIIAVGEPATLYVDQAPPSTTNFGFGGAVTILWEDFSNSDEPWRREHADDVYHLEPFSSEARLWLNSRYGQLRDVLESNAKRGPEASVRDLTAMLIAQPVMLQLCTAALAALEIDEDSSSVSVPSGWRGDAVAMVLPALYPEEPSHEDRLRRAASELREADGASSLTARLGSVVQETLGSFKSVEGAVRSFESIRGRGEESDD